MVLTLCNLRWWCFSFLQLAKILTCSHGRHIYIYIYDHHSTRIQYMRHCFRKKTTTTTTITQCKLQFTSNHHYHHDHIRRRRHHHHSTSYNACIHHMHHCSRKNRPPVQVTVGLAQHQHPSDHCMCQGVHAHNGWNCLIIVLICIIIQMPIYCPNCSALLDDWQPPFQA